MRTFRLAGALVGAVLLAGCAATGQNQQLAEDPYAPNDPLEDVKRQAAQRWVAAVNAEGSYGQWRYAIAKRVGDIGPTLAEAAQSGSTD